MALEGTLRDFSLADIFQLISIQKKTGMLTLKDGADVVTVSFLDGNVVAADSARKKIEDRLGNVLVRSGRISDEQLNRALATQKETLQRLGHVLVQGGYITAEDLKEALRIQVSQMVYRLFSWKDGDYHFTQEKMVDYDRHHLTPLSAESVLLEGVRMVDEWPMIRSRITSFDLVFRKTHPEAHPEIVEESSASAEGVHDLDRALTGNAAEPEEVKPGLRLTPIEATVYEQCDGVTTVQEIVDRALMSDFETCRILYDLASRDLITSSDATSLRQEPMRRGRSILRPTVEAAAWGALVAGVALSVLSMELSPMSGSPRILAPPNGIERLKELVSRNRIQRLDEAIQIYYLQKGFYPDDLGDLLRGNLVVEAALTDPWGRRFGYLSSEDGYRLIAYDEGGVEDLERSLERGRIASEGGTSADGDDALPAARR